jgi:hypothetical protein
MWFGVLDEGWRCNGQTQAHCRNALLVPFRSLPGLLHAVL